MKERSNNDKPKYSESDEFHIHKDWEVNPLWREMMARDPVLSEAIKRTTEAMLDAAVGMGMCKPNESIPHAQKFQFVKALNESTDPKHIAIRNASAMAIIMIMHSMEREISGTIGPFRLMYGEDEAPARAQEDARQWANQFAGLINPRRN